MAAGSSCDRNGTAIEKGFLAKEEFFTKIFL